ncbi:MAG: hypothetical protein COT14_04020 [Candidatus Diapherotrites archaeon CG08_land_8_20_14_0_20_30_16]|nr:MAG: hypothetical protein COT14_04020 [Candidatus Diapherotrites archaeon CG08_land_8_20_14_0_20_30_16]
MDKLDIFKIKELALETKRRVFNIKELSMLLGKSEGTTRSYMARLTKRNIANKVVSGYIAFTDNDYIIANQLIEPSYISLNSALHYFQIILQVPNTVDVICTKQVKLKTSYNYYKINPKLFFGYEKEFAEGTYYFVAEPEKAVLDLIYFYGFSEIYLKDILSKLNILKLKEYVKKYKTIKGYRAKRVLKVGDYIDKQKEDIRISKN